MSIQRTLIILKPEVIERNITGSVLKYFDRDGFKLIAMYSKHYPSYRFRIHYKDVISRVGDTIGADIVSRMSRGPCIFAVYEGPNVIAVAREIIGATDPELADGGTIRNTYGSSMQYNVIHGSDSPESAKREIDLWFPELTEVSTDRLVQGC